MHTKEWSLGKKILIGIISTVIIFALVIGVIYIAVLSNREKVMVVPVSDVMYTDYSEDDFGIQGVISTGTIQNVKKDEGKVAKVYVSVGDFVKKGATLIQFETTTEDLALKQAEINLESRKLELSRAQKKLELLNGAKPYEPPALEDDWNEEAVADDADMEEITSDDGNSSEKGEKSVVVNISGEPLYTTANGEYYTESELRKEKNGANASIASAQTEIKACEEEIEAAQKAIAKRKVTADFDGYITKLNVDSKKQEDATEEENSSSEMVTDLNQDSILLQVSSKDGLFVKSYMSEWKKEQLAPGDIVYIMNWSSGETYEAAITSISDQPSESMTQMYQQQMGGSASYYPFTAQLTGEDIPLSAGDYADVYFNNPQNMYSDDPVISDDGKMNILKAFIRVENGRKYVYIRGENGLLQKQYVKTDGQTRSSYIVTEGLSPEDYIAFPYGKDVRNGAEVREGTIYELYDE